jgi:hypothetical protein
VSGAAPSAPASPPSRTIAQLRERKIEIERDPAFWSAQDFTKNRALVDEYHQVVNQIGDQDAPPPPAAAAAADPVIPMPAPPDGRRWDAEEVNTAVAAAERFGMSKTEAAEWAQYIVDASRRPPPDESETLATLRQEWGKDFATKLAAAQAAVAKMPASFRIMLDRTELGNDPRLIRRMAALGADLHTVRGEILKRVSDPQHPVNLGGHPEHAKAVEELGAMFKTLHGD